MGGRRGGEIVGIGVVKVGGRGGGEVEGRGDDEM